MNFWLKMPLSSVTFILKCFSFTWMYVSFVHRLCCITILALCCRFSTETISSNEFNKINEKMRIRKMYKPNRLGY